jgi:hypothetical protein
MAFEEIIALFKWLDREDRNYLDRERLIDMVYCRQIQSNNSNINLNPVEIDL